MITTKTSNLTTVTSFLSKQDCISTSEHWIIFQDIHSHCLNCIRPHKCMQKLPKFSANIPEKDVFSIMLNVEYQLRSTLGLDTLTSSASPTSVLTPSPPLTSISAFPKSTSHLSSISTSSSPLFQPLKPSQSSPSSSSTSSTFPYSFLQPHLKSSPSKSVNEPNITKTIDKCPVIKCPNSDCGFIFHYCKLKEHLLVCHFEKVECLNSNYGCPFILLRHNMSSHLKHCPAMVVHCSMEWNRWPLHTTEKSSNTRVHCPSQVLDTSNLDVALALRDQRMLKQLWSASRQMKRIMRGRLSVHPAVPIKPYIGIRTHREYVTSVSGSYLPYHTKYQASSITGVAIATSGFPHTFSSSEENENIPQPEVIIVHHDEEKYIRFAQSLVDLAYNESLLEILKFTAENYARKCTEIQQNTSIFQFQRKKANSICPSTKSDFEIFAPLQLSSSSSSINLPVLSDLFANEFRISSSEQNKSDSQTDNAQSLQLSQPPLPPPVPKCNALSLELSIWAYPFFNPKPRPMYTFRCGSNYRSDEIHSHSLDVHSSIHGGLDGWIEYRCPLFQYGCSFVIRRWEPISGFGISSSSHDDSTFGSRQTLIYNETLEAFSCPQSDEIVIVPETPSKLSYESSLKSHNRSVSVASNYTDFAYFQGRINRRRSSNVALNGRMGSCSPSGKTTYSSASIFSSSRLSCPESPVWDSLQEVNLLDLPFELLQHICSYLDPFTLNSLSFTSHLLRNVVKTFLKHKGYVALQWKRYEIEKGQYRWSVANKKWVFSTAITPIKGWKIQSTGAMQKHLQNCPFYNRIEHRHPNHQDNFDLNDFTKSDTFQRLFKHLFLQ